MAMLVVLESLTPEERAVFVLREVFGFAHAEMPGRGQRLATRHNRSYRGGSALTSAGRSATFGDHLAEERCRLRRDGRLGARTPALPLI